MKITLIRHTSVNINSGICYGQSDVEVSSNFEAEALQIALQIKDEKFDAVFCSPLSRCTKLAQYCGYSNPIIDTRLMELNFGDWEMKVWKDINDPQVEHWYSDWINEIPTSGESFKNMILRVRSFIIDLQSIDLQNIAIFTHAGVIRSFGVFAEQFSIEDAFEFKVDYGQITKFRI